MGIFDIKTKKKKPGDSDFQFESGLPVDQQGSLPNLPPDITPSELNPQTVGQSLRDEYARSSSPDQGPMLPNNQTLSPQTVTVDPMAMAENILTEPEPVIAGRPPVPSVKQSMKEALISMIPIGGPAYVAQKHRERQRAEEQWAMRQDSATRQWQYQKTALAPVLADAVKNAHEEAKIQHAIPVLIRSGIAPNDAEAVARGFRNAKDLTPEPEQVNVIPRDRNGQPMRTQVPALFDAKTGLYSFGDPETQQPIVTGIQGIAGFTKIGTESQTQEKNPLRWQTEKIARYKQEHGISAETPLTPQENQEAMAAAEILPPTFGVHEQAFEGPGGVMQTSPVYSWSGRGTPPQGYIMPSGPREVGQKNLTPQQVQKNQQDVGQLGHTLDLLESVYKNSHLLDNAMQAGKMNFSSGPQGVMRGIVSRNVTLKPEESKLVADMNELSEANNVLRIAMGAQGFRGHEAWGALQGLKGDFMAKPDITRNVLRRTMQAVLAQYSTRQVTLARYNGQEPVIDRKTAAIYRMACGGDLKEAQMLAQRHGWKIPE